MHKQVMWQRWGWSRLALARKAGVDYMTLWRWERGDVSPRMSTLIKVADAAGVNAFDIMDALQQHIAAREAA